ncbi:Uncharacterised protein [uncultured archaeon]|nr:Uncharacterised protein [uncultured archaeon]
MGGMGQSSTPTRVCINTTTVTQGQITSLNCNMAQPGYLNLTSSRTCSNLFDSSTCGPGRGTADFSFWFEANGIIRDSSGTVVMYLSPEGMILPSLMGFGPGGASSGNLSVPLPPGNYTLELSPGFEWSRYLGIYNGTNISIISGQSTVYDVAMAESWRINPMFNPSMALSGNNSIMALVSYGQGGQLNDSKVSLNAIILYMNKSAASSSSPLVFNTTTQRFENNTFNPSALGITAGKYLLLLNSTNISGTARYSSTMLMPMYAYDFQIGLDLGGFTFGTGSTATGKIFAFNSTGPIPVNTSPIVVQMLDGSGLPVSAAVSTTDISNGVGAINITMPSKVGFYNIVTKVNASNKFGVSDQWVQVSTLNIQTSTDRFGYQSGDTVALTVSVLNSSNNQPLTASVEVNVDGSSTPAVGTTVNGKATISLAPSTYSTSGSTWSYGWHNLHIKISVYNGGDVSTAETWYGFDVRGIEMQIRPDKPTYTQSDNVILQAFGQSNGISSVKVDGTSLSQCFGAGCAAAGQTYAANNSMGYNQLNLSSGWKPGHHNVEVKASTGGGQQTFYTGFDVTKFSVSAITDKFSYSLNENITLNVTITYPENGSAVNNTPIAASLFKAQPPNDIFVTSATGSTDNTGKLSLKLNATQPGFNYILVNVTIANQPFFIGVQVSSLNITLQNSGGGALPNNEYTGTADGTTPVTIRVNATSGGAAVADGSQVRASVWAFGRQQVLPSNTTAGGIGIISFTIPSEAPVQVYGLEIKVTTPSGDTGFALPATLRVSGGSSLQLSASADHSFMQPYMSNESAIFKAVLTYSNGTPASGRTVSFVYGSDGTNPTKAGSAATGTDGVATLKGISAPSSDGPYYLQASVDGTSIQSYSGFLVSSLNVKVTPNASKYNPGDIMGINITVTNRTSGAAISATGGFMAIFNKEKGKRDMQLNLSGSQPYQQAIAIPNERKAVGRYPIGVAIFSGSSQGFGFTLVDVVNGTQDTINITTAANITANTTTTVNISVASAVTGKVAVYSPAASSLVYSNDSVDFSSGSANLSVALDYPGVYVINVFIDNVGSKTKIISVQPPVSGGGTIPQLWTHTSASTSSSTNTTVFTTSNNVYIMSNIPNATATVMRVNSATNGTVSASLPLKLSSGSTYYAVFGSTELTGSSAYFIRLDTDKASGIAKAMFTVQ